MKTRPAVLLTHDLYDSRLKLLTEYSGESIDWIRADFSKKNASFYSVLEKALCIVSRNGLTEPEHKLAEKLKLIQVPVAGYENIDVSLARKYGVYVCNNGGANAVSVAEHVFLLILALYRQFLFHNKNVYSGSFKNLKYRNLELYGKTIGIIGMGNCGREVARRARAFNMNIVYNDIARPDKLFEQSLAMVYKPVDTLLAVSDIVTLHVPLTPATLKMMDAAKFSLMQKDSVFINTSRGEVVAEDDLVKVLKNRKIRGAGLDVFEKEPLSRSSELLKLDNVVLTPHCGASYESTLRMCRNIAGNVQKISKNKKPDFQVVDYGKLP